MANADQLITDNLDLWSSTVKAKTSAGRGSSKKIELYGITKLRELILDLAVRGMLIPQENADERSSILLKQASDERSRLERDRTIKAVRIKPIEADEEPYKIPESWCWARFPQLCHYSPGKTPSTKNPSFWASGEDSLAIPWVSISDMLHSGSISTTNKKVSTLAKNEVFKREAVKAGSILMSFKLTVGKICRISVDAYHNEAIISITPFTGILDEYIFKFLSKRALEGNTKSAIMGNTLNASSLAQLLIPLPPLAEQHRIVAKVDELMALCDQLEAEQENNLKTHETLVSTLLNTLTSATTDASQFADAWQRIQNNFDILFTTESSVDQLKQTILQLAVMGKLVPQDEQDEIAENALKRISAERENLIKMKALKKRKILSQLPKEKLLPMLPSSWEWCPLDQLIIDMDSGWSPACPPNKSPSNDTWGVLKTTAVQVMEFREDENKVLDGSKSPRPQYEVRTGDILITRAGPKNRVGISCLVEKTRPLLMISDKIIRFHLVEIGISERFISLCLNAGHTWNYLEEAKSGMAESQMNISQGKLREAPIPLAPIREQHRIIAKVDELIALCDQLKESLSSAHETQLNLADSIVEQAIHSPA